jgi:hypothetical protein
MRTGQIIRSLALIFLVVLGSGSLLLLGHTSKAKATPQVELVMPKAQYHIGEEVKFWLTNNGPSEIELPSARPWKIERSDGRSVFAPSNPGKVKIPLAPGETSLKWTWKANILPGKYVVVVSTSLGELRAEFQIVLR